MSTLDDYRWLTGPQAARWLERADQATAPQPALVAALRRELSPERTHLVLEQVELRRRAEAKFAQARTMFFTATGLQQATDEAIAAYKAARWATGDAVLDLCCGIGGDLLAAAARTDVSGVDCDPIVALLANANLQAAGLGGDVRCGRAERIATSEASAWHLDPDRRPGQRRTTRVQRQQPGPEAIERLLVENPRAAIKLAPAAAVPESWASKAELEWISSRGECRQLVVWFGGLARCPAPRRATVIGGKRTAALDPLPRSVCGEPGLPFEVSEVARFVFEPDPAVRAAKLVGALAAEHRLAAVNGRGAYLTGGVPLEDAALACFQVQDVLPFDLRKLKALLRQRRVGRLEVKTRGVRLEPEPLRRRLRVEGDESATLLLCARNNQVTAILARRRVAAAATAGE